MPIPSAKRFASDGGLRISRDAGRYGGNWPAWSILNMLTVARRPIAVLSCVGTYCGMCQMYLAYRAEWLFQTELALRCQRGLD